MRISSLYTHTLQQSATGIPVLKCIGRNWLIHLIVLSPANSPADCHEVASVAENNDYAFICSSVQPQLCSQEGGGMGLNWRMKMDI